MLQQEVSPSTLPPAEEADLARLSWRSLQAVLRESDTPAALAALATEVAQTLACRRVAVGWGRGASLRVQGLSHGAQLGRGAVLGGVEEAMQEAVVQAQTICVPRVADGAVRITLAHRALMRREGVIGVITVPVARQGEVLGAITCERELGRFTAAEIIALEAMAEAVAPVLKLRHEASLGGWARVRRDLRMRWVREGSVGRRMWQFGAAGAVVAIALAAVVPLPHRLDVAARVEGAQQRALTAPVDGFLQQVMVRPGDSVRGGQVLAQLADDDLRLQVRGYQAELTQHENAFIDAFTRGERAQAAMAQSRAAEARAQLERAQQQLARTKVIAPFDGVVIAGDLAQKVGSPVQRSELLLTVAPLSGWRLVLDVDERRIALVQPGQPARVLLTALPTAPIDLRVMRITPLAKSVDGQQRFEVLAEPVGAPPAGWRPGMQGVAQIELAQQPLLVRWLSEAGRGLRWLTWSWW
ncbi:efflux RND transporter periplasmic adaptor subunit [Aquabacterium fontiphilum]|jgi:RND family efflux transporter MFP subunit|uniref:efflux RND transporter periplasmic adaptor subunit n=1 Tax=Aquabacterium fontiphilum TaxID=450365 RepID=UPI0013786E2C|nr:efflux RND transporter periplasmic adaptor subunit [Aquabacterium fontiphilum]NBD19257.1 efflux RND transporter periplasmic adaptor subunit [Aquabacterium fontiphilum]